jgi:ABC-type amino acid transport substrate-binding protein
MRRIAIVLGLSLLAVPAPGQELTGTLKKIKDANAIALGYREASVPFSFVRGDQAVGYSIDLCTRVVASIRQELGLPGLGVKWVKVAPESRVAAVVSGAVDLECGSTSITLTRLKEVDFSHLVFVDGGGLLVRQGTGITALGDLAGKKIAVIPATTTQGALAEALAKASVTAELTQVRDHAVGLAALESGAADAYASDRVLLVGLAATAKDPSRFALLDQYLSYEPYGLMFRRGDADFRLAVNRALTRLYRTPEIWEIYRRWFGALGRPTSLMVSMYLLQALPE